MEYLKIWRPDHWLKNVFIVFGHVVALVLVASFDPARLGLSWAGVVVLAGLSLVPACLIASANYILNEILDAPFDALHPRKKLRGIPAGKVKVKWLWLHFALLIVIGLGLGWLLFPNPAYTLALALLLGSGLVYNVSPVRLKDKTFLDVIAESFNNPIRLWLGWFALVPGLYARGNGALLQFFPDQFRPLAQDFDAWPPVSIMLAWWGFGGLLMTGKRYAEFRFLADPAHASAYRKSFAGYTQRRLIIAMITYANLFCFCTGIAMATYSALNNLSLAFPMIVLAIIFYFRTAMKEENARLEPEQMMKNPLLLAAVAVTGFAALWLLWADQHGIHVAKDSLNLMQPTWEPLPPQP